MRTGEGRKGVGRREWGVRGKGGRERRQQRDEGDQATKR